MVKKKREKKKKIKKLTDSNRIFSGGEKKEKEKERERTNSFEIILPWKIIYSCIILRF